nr:RDD family protein [Shewanella fidelis]
MMQQPTICKHNDPKTWVTPFAFDLASNILYMPLASPLKRGIAMLIDGLLVVVLAETAGWTFVLLVLATLVIQTQSKKAAKLFKWAIYSIMLIGLIMAVVDYYTDIDEQIHNIDPQFNRHYSELTSAENSDSEVSSAPAEFDGMMDIIGYMPAIYSLSQCRDFSCAAKRIEKLNAELADSSLGVTDKYQLIANVVADLPLTEREKEQLLKQSTDTVEQLEVLSPVENSSKELLKIQIAKLEQTALELNKQNAKLEQQLSDVKSNQATEENLEAAAEKTSPLAWLKGLLNDLGLGFGWAAFYFTVFTAWFDGQTLGKKLLGIRVVQLDGAKITLWGAFGRYGGYAAGFTTGLLGFIQIYWDANRQAIQDKISATVVIDVRRSQHQTAITDDNVAQDVNYSINNAADI